MDDMTTLWEDKSKKEAQRRIKLMQAFIEGEAIERIDPLNPHQYDWVEDPSPDWDFTHNRDFRIKEGPQEDIELIAKNYTQDQYIDYGDLSCKAEEQIEKAFTDGYNKGKKKYDKFKIK